MEQAVSSKPARIISMFSKKLESRDIAKKLGHESHKAMATYMKSGGYAWNAEIENYERDDGISFKIYRTDSINRVLREKNLEI